MVVPDIIVTHVVSTLSCVVKNATTKTSMRKIAQKCLKNLFSRQSTENLLRGLSWEDLLSEGGGGCPPTGVIRRSVSSGATWAVDLLLLRPPDIGARPEVALEAWYCCSRSLLLIE